MSNANMGAEVVLEAVVTRADGTVEDLGVISVAEDAQLPEWFQKLKESEAFVQITKGVVSNG
jgi:hypothetical protein